jgi:hypothetical protein
MTGDRLDRLARLAAGAGSRRELLKTLGLGAFGMALTSLPFGRRLWAQTQGATMTVLRGQVAVIHPDGSAIQPAPSGTDDLWNSLKAGQTEASADR